MVLQLLYTHARQRECHLEVIAMLLNHVVKRIEGRHVRTLYDVANGTFVLVEIIVIMVGTDIKETIPLEMYDLMYLKIKANLFMMFSYLYV